MMIRFGVVVVLIVAGLSLQGCATAGIPRGASAPAGQEMDYTLGVAHRTFNVSLDQMRRATLVTFKRMNIALKSDGARADGRELVAASSDRTIYVELEQVTARTTRMRITAKQGWFWRDRTTAGEIIARTERTLANMPAVTERNK